MKEIDKLNYREIILSFPGQFLAGFEAARQAGAGDNVEIAVNPELTGAGNTENFFRPILADAEVIPNFPRQFKQGLEVARGAKASAAVPKIVICGMGGSALAGAILKMILAEAKTPEIVIWRNYGLPANLDRNTLIIAVSYSGNTEETLAAYRSALNVGIRPIAISSGGKLEALARKNGTPFVKIPGAKIPPRTALGYMFAILMKLFVNAGFMPDQSEILLETVNSLNPKKFESEAKALARKIKGRMPLIYISAKWAELAHNWKFRFNENTKIPAFFNVFPELHHNEMAAFQRHKKINPFLKYFYALILEDPKDNLRIKEGIKIFSTLLRRKKVPVKTIPLKGKNIFEKIFANIMLADWTSYWLAMFYGIDPAKTEIIEEFKKRMAS